MKLSYLNGVIANVSAALDTGRHDEISVRDVIDHINQGDLIPWIRETVGNDAEFLLPMPERETELCEALKELVMVYGSGSKFGIENRGLCLVISWVSELIFRAYGEAEWPRR